MTSLPVNWMASQGCLWSEIHMCLKALLLYLLGNGGRISMHCFTPGTSAWEVLHWFSVLSLGGGLQCALEMRDFPWAAGGTHLENAGAAGGKCPVQKQRGAKRKKASRQPALREAGGRKCFDAASGGTLPRGTWREPICVCVRLWAQDFCQCIPVTPKWGTPRQATHRGKEKSLQSAAVGWCTLPSLLCCWISPRTGAMWLPGPSVLPLDLLCTWAVAARCWWSLCLQGAGWAEICKPMRCGFSVLCALLPSGAWIGCRRVHLLFLSRVFSLPPLLIIYFPKGGWAAEGLCLYFYMQCFLHIIGLNSLENWSAEHWDLLHQSLASAAGQHFFPTNLKREKYESKAVSRGLGWFWLTAFLSLIIYS